MWRLRRSLTRVRRAGLEAPPRSPVCPIVPRGEKVTRRLGAPFQAGRRGCNHKRANMAASFAHQVECMRASLIRFPRESMTRRPLLRSILALAALVAAGGSALAQSPLCQRYRAELASLDRGGGQQAAAERQRAEIARLTGYYRSIGCEQRGPFSLFSGAPAECGSISQRIQQLEANYAAIASQAGDPGRLDVRRRELQAAIDQTCAAGQADSGPRGFFESLFGPPRGRAQDNPAGGAPPDIADMPEGDRPLGGGRLVCVRSCDGFFFPLSAAPGGRQNADEMCQALCPGSETTAFSMSGSDDSLSRAVSLRGKPYATLPNAFRYQKAFDESCSCKKDGQNWAQILRQAEGMLDQKRGDILVTAQKSEELSRPKAAQAPPPAPAPTTAQSKRAADKKAAEAAEAQEAVDQAAAAAPTASRESS